MAGALVTLVLVLGGSLLTGQALACLAAGATKENPVEVSWLAPAYGLAALLVLGGIAVRLPGHAVTAAIVLALAIAGSAFYLRCRIHGLREATILGAPVLVITGIAAALPFAIAGFVGILGAGLVNDDMASHLIIADYIADPHNPVPSFIKGGYPIGPHAIVAAIAEVTGAGLVDVFAGFTLALAPLLGWVALGALSGLSRVRRIVGACLVALSYLGIAYLLQGAFKEPILSILLLGMALCLGDLIGVRPLNDESGSGSGIPAESNLNGVRPPLGNAHPILRVLPLGFLVAGVVFVYSLPGLLWVALICGAVVAARVLLVKPRPILPDDWVRKFAPYAAGVVVVLLVATAQEWSRLDNFTRFSALNPDRFGSQLGNLRGSLNPLEALGIWPAGDFRTAATDTSGPTIITLLGAAAALAAFASGLVQSLLSRRNLTPAVTAVAALVVWGFLAVAGSPYVAAKGLAIAAPFVMLVAVAGTFGSKLKPLLALGVVLAAGAVLSAFLVVRQAPVGPDNHANQLADIRAKVQGKDVLFLGRDDFIGWELRGSGEITGVVTNFYDVEDIRPRFKKGKGGGEKFDVDVLFPRQLDKFDWIVATTGGPASQVPPRFEEAARTDDYVLYHRTGSVGKRATLDEGTQIGAFLNCDNAKQKAISEQKGYAVIWDPPPAIGDADKWTPSDEPTDGAPVSQRLGIPGPGKYLISLEYDSRRPLHVTIPELGIDTTVPANLDFRGETPTFPVAEGDAHDATQALVTVEPEEPNLLGQLLHAPNDAHLRSITATPLDPNAVRRVPLKDACGEYVDWYHAG